MQVLTRQIHLLAVGKLGTTWRPAADDYLRRLRRILNVDVDELRQAPLSAGPAAACAADSTALLARLQRLEATGERPAVLVADSRGKSLTSEALAEWVAAQPRIVAVVGGAGGLSDAVRQRADLQVAFGRLTFPHELARVMLCEQLYRSMKILRGEPYHW